MLVIEGCSMNNLLVKLSYVSLMIFSSSFHSVSVSLIEESSIAR